MRILIIFEIIKKIKNIFRKILLKFNINVYNFSSKDDILDLLKLFIIKIPNNIDFIRWKIEEN